MVYRRISKMWIDVTPSVAITLAINPPVFRINDPVELSLTVVSNASYPITVFTFPTILNPDLGQIQGNLKGFDRDTLEPLQMHDIDIRRVPYNHTFGDIDDKYHVTLEPGVPSSFKAPFEVARKYPVGISAGLPLPGHRYLVDLAPDESLFWWKKGRKEDIMCKPGGDYRLCRSVGWPGARNCFEPR